MAAIVLTRRASFNLSHGKWRLEPFDGSGKIIDAFAKFQKLPFSALPIFASLRNHSPTMRAGAKLP
jgi:hypothetical protein